MARIPVLEDLGDVNGKTVLVRTDFNVPMDGPDNARVIVDDFRIRAALPTINWLPFLVKVEHGRQEAIALTLERIDMLAVNRTTFVTGVVAFVPEQAEIKCPIEFEP